MSLRYLKQSIIRIVSIYIYQPFFKLIYRFKFKHLAPVDKNILINIDNIKGWYRGSRYGKITFPGIIKDGDWSYKTTSKAKILEESSKYHSVKQRYIQDIPWSETDLFKNRYAAQIEKGYSVKGYNDMKELKRYYIETYDRLFESLKKNGVKPSTSNTPDINPIYIIIDKNGELLYTVDGNHRLFMCMVLEIEEIPVRVWMRHTEWQKKRDYILSRKGENIRDEYQQHLSHPDIASELPGVG